MFEKKYKIKKRKKAVNPYLIFSLIAISMLFVSYSYALLLDTLTIRGFANILSSNSNKYEYGNSTYTYETREDWVDPEGNIIYEVYVCITNLDEDFLNKEIVVSFDTNSEFNPEDHSNNCNVWQAASITKTGSRITIVFSKAASWVSLGDDIDIHLQMPFKNPQSSISITNLTLNNKYVKCLNPDSGDTPSVPTNTVENTTVANNTIENTTVTNNTTENTTIANNTTENTTIANNTTENTTITNNTIENTTIANNTTENTTTQNTTPTPDIPSTDLANSSYNYKIINSWDNTYAIDIPISYYGQTINPWTISITIPDGLDVNSSVFYQCSSISLSGNVLTLTPYSWSSTLTSGSTLTLSGQLKFTAPVNFSISDLTINGTSIPYTP